MRLKGILVNDDQITVMEKGSTYYLEEHGESNFYVFRKKESKGHMGSFQKSRFEIVKDEEEKKIESGQVYYGLMYQKEGYPTLELKNYYMRLNRKTHVFIYQDSELEQLRGCFPISWFKDIKHIDEIPQVEEEPKDLVEVIEGKNGQMELFI